MSISSQCGEAVDRLIERGCVFTEIDVVNEAAKAHGWGTAMYSKGLRAANIKVGERFRERKLARYGPVTVPGIAEVDFARIVTKIAYASADKGPKFFIGPNGERCPNGRFPMMLLEDVPAELNRQGRRAGARRNDLEPWDNQTITGMTVVDSASPPEAPQGTEKPGRMAEVNPSNLERKCVELETSLQAANLRIEELERELDRIRVHKASDIDNAVFDLIAELDSRVRRLEDPERIAS